MKDLDHPKESARERATRRWHNNHVLRHLKSPQDHVTVSIPIKSAAYKEILKVITEKNNNTVRNYLIALRERRVKLLKEKLRRLRSENINE